MNETEFKFPEWQAPFQELLLESDTEKLTRRTQEMEAIFLDRLQQLNRDRDGQGEKDAIFDALKILRIVKRDKLGFPDWE